MVWVYYTEISIYVRISVQFLNNICNTVLITHQNLHFRIKPAATPTVSPRSCGRIYIVIYYITWTETSLTDSSMSVRPLLRHFAKFLEQIDVWQHKKREISCYTLQSYLSLSLSPFSACTSSSSSQWLLHTIRADKYQITLQSLSIIGLSPCISLFKGYI